MEAKKEKIRKLLDKVQRPGVEKLRAFLDESGFYTSPGSTKYHGCYEGGLLNHVCTLYDVFSDMNYNMNLGLSEESIVIVVVGHDLCKPGAYKGTQKPYAYNQMHPKGHAKLSLKRLKELIELTPQEELIIRYHMGLYCTHESGMAWWAEYSLKELMDVYNANPICKMFHFADEIATQMEKMEEGVPLWPENV